VKLGTSDDVSRIRAVRSGAPRCRLIVDANEGWPSHTLPANLAACADVGVELIEQPLPAGDDAALAEIERTVRICADESLHDRTSLARLAGRYDAINVKLDKAGGLTEALAVAETAKGLGLGLMVGCMVGTSLAMAPGLLLAQHAEFVDLDGPLLLARDREPSLLYEGSTVYPPTPGLWG
jgi:L-alanine-DL-glutamate epimerase-like enolase superfamily enzyme